MHGAILGDMIGAPYEFDMGNKSKEFPLFCEDSHFTDDSVMTIAVAEALLDNQFQDDITIKDALVDTMRKWGKKYPAAGYGGRFWHWLMAENPEPYGSYGNGSAMRVSSAGWLFDTIEDTRAKSRTIIRKGLRVRRQQPVRFSLRGPVTARMRAKNTL